MKSIIFRIALIALLAVCPGRRSEAQVTTNIAWAKRATTNIYVPDDMTTVYRLRGRITSPNFAASGTQFYIQGTNDNVGLCVSAAFAADTNVFKVGREAVVVGNIVQYTGVTAINPTSSASLLCTNVGIVGVAPVAHTIASLLASPEAYESQFVVISNVALSGTNWPAWGSDMTVASSDGSGSLSLRIDAVTDIDGQLPPTNAFDVKGIFTQFDTSTNVNGGYRIQPRYYSDLVQSVGQQPPSLYVALTRYVAVTGYPVNIRILGRDRNAGDVLALTCPLSPGTSTFTDFGNREGLFNWTPGPGYLNTTGLVDFAVSDGASTVTTRVRIVVRGTSGGPGHPWINEFHYNNSGVDVGEGVELAGTSGIDLGGYYILLYSGSDGLVDTPSNDCSGVIDNEGNGYGAVWFPIAGMHSGSAYGIALVSKTEGVLQFISYEGAFTANDGPATAMISLHVGVAENYPEPQDGYSLQLQGSGTNYEAFAWSGPMYATPGEINGAGQTLNGPAPAKVVHSGVSLSPPKPPPYRPFDIVASITPNYSASNLVATAWCRMNGGLWTSHPLERQGGYAYRTADPIPSQPDGTLIDYYVSTTFDGPGTNSPIVTATSSYLIQFLAPAFAPLTNRAIDIGNPVQFTVRAAETDGDWVTLTASNLPANAVFRATNGTGAAAGSFEWTNAEPVGVYTAMFYAADKDSVTSTSVLISVVGMSAGSYTGSVWINEFRNGGGSSGAGDVVELVVVSNNLDMRGIMLRDYTSNGSSDGGGAYVFSSSVLWASVRAGTIIVLTNNASADDTVAGGADYNLAVGLKNTTYFASEGTTFDIATEEIIQLKGPGSTRAGVDGAIHTLATAGTTNFYVLSPSPKLQAGSGNTQAGESVFASNSTAQAADFDGTDAAGDGLVGTIGTWNTPANQAYILGLRGCGDVDGIPVSWWDRHGILPGQRIATNNPDGDADSNFEEYAADTDPTNSASYLVHSVTHMSGFGTLQLPIGPPTTNSRLYDAFWCTNLVTQAWNPIGLDVSGEANGAALYLTVTNDAGGRFYRTGVKVP